VAKQDKADLLGFLEAFDPGIQSIALHLRDSVWDLYPQCNELIYDGRAALAFGWGPTDRAGDIFCSCAIYNNDGVLFGFLKGSVLADPEKLLEGGGKQYRYIRVREIDAFPRGYAEQLLAEAYDNSMKTAKNLDEAPSGQTIVKSISEKKRRPIRPADV
jgi:hypothetical protein